MAWNDVVQRSRRRYATAPAGDLTSNAGTLAGEQSLYDSAAGTGAEASNAYLDSAENFDASKALNTYAQGSFSKISTALNAQLEKLRGSSVGAGRFDSGLLDQDTGVVARQAYDDFSSNLATQALGASGQQQRNTESLGAYGQAQTGTAADLLTGRREEIVNAEREKAAARRAKKRGIGAAIGGVLGAGVGAVFGGPAGAGAGYQAGSNIGGGF